MTLLQLGATEKITFFKWCLKFCLYEAALIVRRTYIEDGVFSYCLYSPQQKTTNSHKLRPKQSKHSWREFLSFQCKNIPSCWWWNIFSMTRSCPRWRARDRTLSPSKTTGWILRAFGRWTKRIRLLLKLFRKSSLPIELQEKEIKGKHPV